MNYTKIGLLLSLLFITSLGFCKDLIDLDKDLAHCKAIQLTTCTSNTCVADLLANGTRIGSATVDPFQLPCQDSSPVDVARVKVARSNCSSVSGIGAKVTVTPGQQYCVTALGNLCPNFPASPVQIFVKQGAVTTSSTTQLTTNYAFTTLTFTATSSTVCLAVGVSASNISGSGAFNLQKFTIEACTPCTPRSLNIVLTNDDGATDIGIQTLFSVFTAAGHTVFIVAPSAAVDGSGTAINLTPIFIQEFAANQWAVSVFDPVHHVPIGPATPITSVANFPDVIPAGTNIDLIISGINAEAVNAGPAALSSGTVAGAIATISQLLTIPQIPAIAVSGAGNRTPARVTQIAEFVLEVVNSLECSSFFKNTGKLLPLFTGLNINYPNLDPGAISGVKITQQGLVIRDPVSGLPVGLQYNVVSHVGPVTITRPAVGPLPPSENVDIPDSDSLAVSQGFISIEPITPNLSANYCQTTQFIDAFSSLPFPVFGTITPQDLQVPFSLSC